LLPDGSANDILYQLLQEQQQEERQQKVITNDSDNEPKTQAHNSPTPIQLTGVISKRRAIGKHLIFLDVIPVDKIPTLLQQQQQKKGFYHDSLREIAPVQAIMRRDFWNDIQKQRSDNNIGNTTSSATSFDVYHKIIQPGTYCTIHGHVGPSRNQKEAILFCTSLKYRLANNNPQHLRNVLKFVADGVLDVNEVLEALPTLSHEDELVPSSSTAAGTSNQTYGELATQILDTFPPKFLLNPSQMMGSTDAAKVQLLPPVPHEFGTLPPIIITEVKEKVAVSDSLTISQALQQQKQEHDNGLVSITGWVQNRRRYQGSVSVLEVVDTFSSSFRAMNGDEDDDSNNNSNNINDSVNSKKLKEMWKERIYAVIHPDALCSEEMAEMYGNLLSAGARFMMEGFMTKSDDKDDEMPSFWVTRIRLLRSSWRQGEIRTLLDLVHEGKFLDIEEAARALNIPYSQAEELAEGTATPAERQWLAAEITMKLQGENSRVGKISNKMVESLSTFADERDRYPIQEERSRLAADGNSSQPVVSSILESNLGGNPRRTSLDGSRWQHKKRPQLQL
jgi:hypothetical protein